MLTVDILPTRSGEWWVTAQSIAGSTVTVEVWRSDGPTVTLESSSRLRGAGQESTMTRLMAGLTYAASFTPFGKPGTSVLHEHFSAPSPPVARFVFAPPTPTIRDTVTFDGSGSTDPDGDIVSYDWQLGDASAAIGAIVTHLFSLPGAFEVTLTVLDSTGLSDRTSQPVTVTASAGEILWIRSTESSSQAEGIAVDPSGVYVAGSFGSDVFVRKYDASGNEVWTRVFGTAGAPDVADSIAVDPSGVYVAGSFGGDVFVRKYDASGNEVWTRQFGSSGTSSGDRARAIAVDASGLYVAGYVQSALPGQTLAGNADAFVRKYDADGQEIWTRQFGTTGSDTAEGIAVDASGVYVVGSAGGALPGQAWSGDRDAFVRKYDLDGNEIWTRQFGADCREVEDEFGDVYVLCPVDGALAVAGDASGVYLAGTTWGALPGQTWTGDSDAFIRKYDADGNEVWTREFGNSDGVLGIDVDSSGLFIAGMTGGAGNADAFMGKYAGDGSEVWMRVYGNPDCQEVEDDLGNVYVYCPLDHALGIAVDEFGVYVAGWTSLVNGARHAWVARLAP